MKTKNVVLGFLLFFFGLGFAILTKNWVTTLLGTAYEDEPIFLVILIAGMVVFGIAAIIIAPMGIIRSDEEEEKD